MNKKNNFPTSPILAQQAPLCPPVPLVLGNVDYRNLKERLEAMDVILRESGVEKLFVQLSTDRYLANAARKSVEPGADALVSHQRRSMIALRCTVLGNITGRSLRDQSMDLAMSPLYRRFCLLEQIDKVKVPAKSTLGEYRQWLPAAEMSQVNDRLARAAGGQCGGVELGLGEELDLSVLFCDSTALEANIHFPVDWVLLRDGVRTLVKSILTIRRHGLLHRIGTPEDFLSKINKLTIAMSAQGRRAGSKAERKRVLRAMKKLAQVVRKHGTRYRDLLDAYWQRSDLSRKQAEVILRRMDQVLDQLPAAIKQAHERIIGERQVANAEKILSLYEPDAHVIVRHKAGAAIEYGNSLFVVEQGDGLVVDYDLCAETSPGDAKWLAARLPRLQALQGEGEELNGLVADRGFDSAALRGQLAEHGIFNGLCPRDPKTLGERMEADECFVGGQRRRAGTEARIAILKQGCLQAALRAKGFTRREQAVGSAVLTHNLWLLACKRCRHQNQLRQAQVQAMATAA